MHAIWGLGMLSLTKGIVIVDEHVDVHDYNAVMFYVGANVDPKRDVRDRRRARSTTSTTPRPCSSSAARSGSTRPPRGRSRARASGRPEIEMDAETRELVDRRWEEYGLGTVPQAAKRPDPSEFAPAVTTLTRCDPDRLNPV